MQTYLWFTSFYRNLYIHIFNALTIAAANKAFVIKCKTQIVSLTHGHNIIVNQFKQHLS